VSAPAKRTNLDGGSYDGMVVEHCIVCDAPFKTVAASRDVHCPAHGGSGSVLPPSAAPARSTEQERLSSEMQEFMAGKGWKRPSFQDRPLSPTRSWS
jgi:hypothetical protein